MEGSREIFISEAEEMLTLMNNSLVALEKNPGEKKLIDEIFRSAHTIKGMAGCEGLTTIQEFSHAIEDLLNKIREGQIAVSRSLMDIVFSATDKLESLVQAVKKNEPLEDVTAHIEILVKAAENAATEMKGLAKNPEPAEEEIPEKLLPKTQEMEAGDKTDESTERVNACEPKGAERRTHLRLEDSDRIAIADGRKEGLVGYELVISMKKTSIMMQARVSVIMKTLQSKGKIINRDRVNKGILSGKFGRHFGLFFMTKKEPSEIRSGIEDISDVERVTMTVLYGDDILTGEQKEAQSSGSEEKKTKNKIKTRDDSRDVQAIRVNVTKLDRLMNLIGELVIYKIRLNNVVEDIESPEVKDVVSNIDRLTQDLQDIATKTRLVPVDSVFSRFQRMVRDSARESGKEINFEISGSDIELDRTILEGITDALVHLLRNAVSHGLESPAQRKETGKNLEGCLKLSARREKNKVMIEVSDDGRGLDPEKIRAMAKEKKLMSEEEIDNLDNEQACWLITKPGFSTKQVADGLSGRGVGMDVAQTVTESFGGRLMIKSELGLGSTFTLELPLSMSIIKVLLVMVSGQKYAIPLTSILETVRVEKDAIRQMRDSAIFNLRGEVLSVVQLREVLNLEADTRPETGATKRGQIVCIVEAGYKKAAIAVDSLVGQQEAVVKILPQYGGKTKGLSGVTILSDGHPCLILDVGGII